MERVTNLGRKVNLKLLFWSLHFLIQPTKLPAVKKKKHKKTAIIGLQKLNDIM